MSGDDARVAFPLFHAEYGGSIPTSPLQLRIEEINVHLACKLNAAWHSRLPEIHWSNVVRNLHYVCFGAIHANIYYAVAIWSSPIARSIKNAKPLSQEPHLDQVWGNWMLLHYWYQMQVHMI